MKDFIKEKQQEAKELIDDRKVINKNKETNLSDLKIVKIMTDTPIRDDADVAELNTLTKAYLDENSIIHNEQSINQEKINHEISEIDDYKTDLEHNIDVYQNIEKASDLIDTSKEIADTNKRIRDLDALKIVLGLGAMIDVNSVNTEYQKVHNPLSNPEIAIISQRTEQKNTTIPEPIRRIVEDIDKQIPVKIALNNIETAVAIFKEPAKWDKMSKIEQKQAIIKLSNQMATEMNITKPPRVHIFNSPPECMECPFIAGVFDNKKNLISINEYILKSPSKVVNTLAHEMKHKEQFQCGDNPLCPRHTEYKEAFKNYLSPENAGVSYADYLSQMVEVEAREHGKNFVKKWITSEVK